MRTRAFALATLVALVPASIPRPSSAQTGVDDAVTNMARARFKEGVSFFDKGEYDKARAAFMQAYALKKHPTVLLNLAWSCLKGSHTLEAEQDFQLLLTDGGKDLTDKQRADATDGLTQARAKLGRIEISAPAGTQVTLDGEHEGSAPLEPVWVEPGAHTVSLKADDATQTMSLSVLPGETAVGRFARAAVPAVSPPPEPAQRPPPPPPPQPPLPPEEPPPPPTPPAAANEEPAGGPGPFSTPSNVAPMFAFGGVAVLGFVGAGVALAFKGQAQDSANQIVQQIVAKGGGSATCTNPTRYYQQACGQLNTDSSDVNSDATAGNVLLGVGVAATVGGLAYWLLADKKHAPVTLSGSASPQFHGLLVSGVF